jgi:hypothetical protein
MNTAENRTEYISLQLHRHWITDVGIPVIAVEPADWDSDPETLGPTAVCGWAWPLILDDGSRVVTICPELIATVTSHLEHEHLDDYLGIIEFTTDRQITLMVGFPDVDPWERHKKILDNLQEDHPLAFGLLQEIQLKANS